MGYRDPVVVYVNYFFAFQDDKYLTFRGKADPALRAASIVRGGTVLHFPT